MYLKQFFLFAKTSKSEKLSHFFEYEMEGKSTSLVCYKLYKYRCLEGLTYDSPPSTPPW